MKILYLFARQYFESKMSPGRILYAEAMAQQPGVEVRFWGAGWDGFDTSLTLAENLRNLDWDPTHLWLYKAQLYREVAEVKLPRLVVFNEAFDDVQTSLELRAAAATHVVFHHEGDFIGWRNRVPRAYHLPHAGLPFATPPPPLSERAHDCLVTGRLEPDIYPLRCKLARLVQRGKLPGVVRPHPGYRLDGHSSIREQYESYRNDLCQARLGLGCSSVYRYNLARFAELALAGTVIVSDMPNDESFRKLLAPWSVILPDRSSSWRIKDLVRDALKDPSGLQQRSDGLRRTAERELSMDRYAQRLVELLRHDVAPKELRGLAG